MHTHDTHDTCALCSIVHLFFASLPQVYSPTDEGRFDASKTVPLVLGAAQGHFSGSTGVAAGLAQEVP